MAPQQSHGGATVLGAVVVEILVRPAADAFLQVGVWVAVMLFAFHALEWRTGGGATALLERHRRLGPLVGAVLGVSPGCGGAIVVMPLYTGGTVSFGTVVATLVATMGDSSFVLLAAAPRTALAVHALLLAAGIVTGCLVDLVGIAPELRLRVAGAATPPSTVGAAAAETDVTGRLAYRFPSTPLVGFWFLVAAGLVVGVPVVFRLASESAITSLLGGGVNPYLVVGSVGSVACTVVALVNVGRPAGTHCQPSPRGGLRRAARETATVTSWVLVAFVAWAALEAATGLDAASLPVGGVAGVVAGAAVGLIPGCGPQIVLTSLYAQGALPLSTLVANALSQDGDALFPLMASDRRSALAATVVTTIPALVVGLLLHAAGG